MKRAGETFSYQWLLIHRLSQKRIAHGHLVENSCKCNYFNNSKNSLKILIPQSYIDFHDCENGTSTRKLPLNSFQTSQNNKYIEQNSVIHWI